MLNENEKFDDLVYKEVIELLLENSFTKEELENLKIIIASKIPINTKIIT